MSENPRDGVVNKWGQTHGIANLFVSDGSQFTTETTGNPTLTIVPLAIRLADHITSEMGAGNLQRPKAFGVASHRILTGHHRPIHKYL